MKRTYFILVTGMMLMLAGCQKQEASSNPPDAPETATVSIVEQSADVAQSKPANVPEHIFATWTSNTGVTQIQVDAEVYFEAYSELPVYEVCPRLITKDEVVAFANALFEEGEFEFSQDFIDVQDMSDFEGVIGGGRETQKLQVAKDTFIDIPVKNISFYTWEKPDCFLKFEYLHDAEDVTYSTGGSVCSVDMLTAEQLEAFPFEGARDTADRVVSAVSAEFECTSYGFRTGYYPYDEREDGIQVQQSGTIAYVFYYTRPYAGIQTTYTEQDCIAPVNEGRDGVYISNVSYESIEIMVSERGVESMIYHTPHDVVGVISQETGILPFEEILTIAEQILPLRLASWEQSGGANAAVDRIEFGYMRVRMRDEPTRFMMIPVWDFFGSEYRSNAEDEIIIPNQSLLTINAMDGTVIDRSYGY